VALLAETGTFHHEQFNRRWPLSRTEKTKPFWARLRSDPVHLAIEVHDHAAGPCDLPEMPGPGALSAHDTRCSWGPSSEALHGKHHGDGCAMCTNHHGRRRDRRRSRHQAVTHNHAIEQQYPDDIDE
jgi:hypothetical protein